MYDRWTLCFKLIKLNIFFQVLNLIQLTCLPMSQKIPIATIGWSSCVVFARRAPITERMSGIMLKISIFQTDLIMNVKSVRSNSSRKPLCRITPQRITRNTRLRVVALCMDGKYFSVFQMLEIYNIYILWTNLAFVYRFPQLAWRSLLLCCTKR